MQTEGLWPRVEILRLFILLKLRRILLVRLCRVEMQLNARLWRSNRAHKSAPRRAGWPRRSSLIRRRILQFLMCVRAPVRNFSVVCFVGVTSNSVCEAEPVRNAGKTNDFVRNSERLRCVPVGGLRSESDARRDG